MVEKCLFGVMEDGTDVYLYRIYNSRSEYAELLSYGASLHSLMVQDKNGNLGDVVLGAKDIQNLHGFSTEGAIMGRCANRIADGRFCIDGNEYRLQCGNNAHCLHSGDSNFAKQHFTATINNEANSVTFYLEDKGECGFACELKAWITYSWNDMRQLTIEYEMIPEGTTLISPTNHAYFSMGTQDIRSCVLQICADQYAVKSDRGLPEGETAIVRGTHLDFTEGATIYDAFGKMAAAGDLTECIDENYILNGEGFRKAASLFDPQSGRQMQVSTDMPGLVLFTMRLMRPIQGKNNIFYQGHCFVCLETQYISNAVNCETFKKPVFRQGESMKSKTIYQFTVK